MELQLFDVLLSCFALAFLSGWVRYAHLRLRSKNAISFSAAFYAGFVNAIHSGVIGIIIGLVWCNWYADRNVAWAIAASGIVGITGMDIAGLLKALVIRALQSMLASLAPEKDHDRSDS